MSNINERFVVSHINAKKDEYYLIDDGKVENFTAPGNKHRIKYFYSRSMAAQTMDLCKKENMNLTFSIKRVAI